MIDPIAVLVGTWVVLLIAAAINVSRKTGFIVGSMQSLNRGDQPKYQIDREKVGNFFAVCSGVLILSIIYSFIVVRDTHELAGILAFSLVDTVIIGYGISYNLLFREKKKRD